MKKLTFEQAKKQIFQKTGFELLDYSGAIENSTFKCPACNNTFVAQYHNIKYNRSCPHCRKIKYQKSIMEKAIKIHGDKYDYIEIPKDSYDFFKYLCKNCGETHTQFVQNHIASGQGCPRCCKPTGGYGRVVPLTFLEKPQLADKPATFYIVKMKPRDGGEHYFKFGCTTIQLSTRLANVKFHAQCDTEVVYSEKGRYLDMFFLEAQFGLKTAAYKSTHKWLGSGETFNEPWEPLLNQCGHDLKSEKTRLFLDDMMNVIVARHGG